MEIGATKAVQDRLKTTKIEESKGASLVFCWDTHLTKIKGRNVLFIVNASNRYTIAMTDIEPRNWNYYTMYISSVIHGVMQEMGYSEDQIGQYFKMSGDTTVTKTHGRKSVGGINRMVMDAQYFGKKLEKEAKYQWELSEYLFFAAQREFRTAGFSAFRLQRIKSGCGAERPERACEKRSLSCPLSEAPQLLPRKRHADGFGYLLPPKGTYLPFEKRQIYA